MNNVEILKTFMQQGMTPKGIVQKMVGNNPIFNNLIQMADSGDTKGIENFARNILKERGLDFDKELDDLKKKFN